MLFELLHDFKSDRKKLMNVIKNKAWSFHSYSEFSLSQLSYETWKDADKYWRNKHQTTVKECLDIFANAFIYQWHQSNVSCNSVDTLLNIYIFVKKITENAQIWFQSWYCNVKFKEYINKAQNILNNLNVEDQKLLLYFFLQFNYHYCLKQSHIEFHDIMRKSAFSLSSTHLENFDFWISQQVKDEKNHDKLKSLLDHLKSKSLDHHEQWYVIDLLKSFNSLHDSADDRLSKSSKTLWSLLKQHLTLCKNHVNNVYQMICNRLQKESFMMHWLACWAKMWLRLSIISLLEHLADDRIMFLHDNWKSTFIEYEVVISNLQRVKRLFTCIENNLKLLSELSNLSHQD